MFTQGPNTFEIDVEYGASGVNVTRWASWQRSFELWANANVIPEDRKFDWLMHLAGNDIYDIYTWDRDPGRKAEHKNYEYAVAVIRSYFAPGRNVPLAIRDFREMRQLDGEGVDAFLSRLRKAAESCEFRESQKADEMRQQFLMGTSEPRVHNRGFAQPDLPFAELRTYARGLESAAWKARNGGDTVASMRDARPSGQRPKANGQLECFKCGGAYPHTADCLAQGKKCRSCGCLNHFAEFCQKTKRGDKSGSCRRGQATKPTTSAVVRSDGTKSDEDDNDCHYND